MKRVTKRVEGFKGQFEERLSNYKNQVHGELSTLQADIADISIKVIDIEHTIYPPEPPRPRLSDLD